MGKVSMRRSEKPAATLSKKYVKCTFDMQATSRGVSLATQLQRHRTESVILPSFTFLQKIERTEEEKKQKKETLSK